MEGVLAAAVSQRALTVTDSQMEQVRRAARARARTDLLLERETLRAARLLEESAVPYRILKGPALAHSAYPDPMWRSFGDVDILIPPSRWYEALAILAGSGATRRLPELRPNFDARFGKDATFVTAMGWEIDLHRTLVVGPYGLWIDCDELFSRTAGTISLGASEVSVLDPHAAFVHACYTAALADDPPRLAALRDVAQLALGTTVDPDATFAMAAHWRGVGVVRRALTLASSGLGLPLGGSPVGRRFAGEVPRRDRILLATYRGQGRGYTSQLAGLVAIHGMRPKLAYLSALARPQRAYLEARGFTESSFLRHALRRVKGPR
jgi:hypothetical protein